MRKQSRVVINNLDGSSTHGGSYHWFFFPQRFGNSQGKALSQAFLNHNGRSPLKRVNFEWRPGRQLYHSNVRVVVRLAQHFFQYNGALRIIRGAAPGKYELAIEISLYDTVGADHANGILQAVEPRYFTEDSPQTLNPVPGEHLLPDFPLPSTILF